MYIQKYICISNILFIFFEQNVRLFHPLFLRENKIIENLISKTMKKKKRNHLVILNSMNF